MSIRSISAQTLATVEALRKRTGAAADLLLAELEASGELAVIRALIPLALDQQDKLAPKIRETIARLVTPHLPDALPDLDEWLRRGDPWQRRIPDDVWSLPLASDSEIVFLGVCASHASGYLREAAVARLALAGGGVELPFLILRANDWVAPVAIRARTAVVARINVAYAGAFVRCLALLDRLMLAKRNDLRDVVASVHDLLLSEPARPMLRDALQSSNQGIRRRCWLMLGQRGQTVPYDMAEGAIRGGDPISRRFAYEAVLRTGDGEQRDRMMIAAAVDASAAVRHMALEYWIHSAHALASEMIQACLFDRAPDLRARARYVWQHRTGEEALPLYQQALPTATGARLIGSIYGIGETGMSADAPLVRAYAHHPRALVRIAAIRAGWRLDRAAMRPWLIDALLKDSPGVAREARLCLEKDLAWIDWPELWTRASSGVARRRILTMCRQLDKWDRLRYILRGLAVDDPDTVVFARGELTTWNDAFNKSYVPLSPLDRDGLLDLLAARQLDARDSLIRIVRFTIERA